LYLHTIRSGSRGQYIKRLLRTGRREGQRVVNRTVANVSTWPDDRIAKLQNELKIYRMCRGTGWQAEADRWLFSLLLAQGIEPWRLMQTEAPLLP
jgi:hypothetical protein